MKDQTNLFSVRGGNVSRNIVHSIQQLLYGTGNFLDGVEESLTIVDLVGDTAENFLEVRCPAVEFLERVFRPRALQVLVVRNGTLKL